MCAQFPAQPRSDRQGWGIYCLSFRFAPEAFHGAPGRRGASSRNAYRAASSISQETPGARSGSTSPPKIGSASFSACVPCIRTRRNAPRCYSCKKRCAKTVASSPGMVLMLGPFASLTGAAAHGAPAQGYSGFFCLLAPNANLLLAIYAGVDLDFRSYR